MHRGTAAMLAAILMLPIVFTAARAQAAAPFPVVPLEPPTPRRHTWAYLTLAGGATLVGLSFTFSGKADDAYAAYLASTDQDEIQTLYDRAVRYDHRAQASLLTGEAMIAAGLYLRFVRRPGPSRVSLSLGPVRCALSCRF
ncbi:MAG: hypothetical protein ACRENJ_08010 [Candidatus Eiseniibacteriota bacterium]